jgi:DNA mismatch endonuclease (patch repair protein)
MPSSNVDYWKAKIERNVQRDKAAVEALTRSGWRVHVIWECDLDAGIENLLRTLREHQIGD